VRAACNQQPSTAAAALARAAAAYRANFSFADYDHLLIK
jgi:hypothetical protein